MKDIPADFQFELCDTRAAADSFYTALTDHLNVIRQEVAPEDLPTTPENTKNRLQSMPDFLEMPFWVVRDPATARIIANGAGMMLNTGQNEHLCQVDIRVEPAYRQQGLGSALLWRIADYAASHERSLLLFNTYGNVPAGEAFMNWLGAEPGLVASINRLQIADVDQALLRRWIAAGEARAGAVQLGLWTGPYPEAAIDDVVALMEVMDSQPRDDLDVEDFKFSAEQIRALEKNQLANGAERWSLYAQDATTGQLVGFTEIFTKPNNPATLEQGNTGVFPAYRGRGIGRWLKAAMLEKVLAERPDVRYIDTGNADSNAPMLKINHELGFRKHRSSVNWQMATAKALAALD